MCVHKAKGEDDHVKSTYSQIHTVHAADEIVIIQEYGIYGVAVGTEMPAILDRDVFPFGERDIKSQVGINLLEQFIFYLHFHIQHHKRLLNYKDSSLTAHCQKKSPAANIELCIIYIFYVLSQIEQLRKGSFRIHVY